MIAQHLLLDAVVDLDRQVDPQPDEDRQPGDRDERQVDADPAEERERPQHADEHRQQRQQPAADPEHDEQHDDHHGDGDQAEAGHAALQVVVDLSRYTGEPVTVSSKPSNSAVSKTSSTSSVPADCSSRRGVAVEHDAADGDAWSRERPLQRQPDRSLCNGRCGDRTGGVDGVAVVAPQQQLVPRRVADLLVRRALQPGEGDLDVGGARLLARRIRLAGQRRRQRRRAGTAAHEAGAPLDGGQRRDHGVHLVDRGELGVDPLQRRQVLALEQLRHVGAVRRRQQHDHGLAAELVLDGDLSMATCESGLR